MRALKYIAVTALIFCLIWFMLQGAEQVNDTPGYEAGVEYGEAADI